MKKPTIYDWNGDHNKAWNPETEKFETINSLWDRLKWKLFGETKILCWIFGINLLISFLFFGAIIGTIIHFTIKYW